MTLATQEESLLYMIIYNYVHICCQVSAEGGSRNHLPGKAEDPDLLSEWEGTLEQEDNLSLEGAYQICWILDIFSFEFMSTEVMDSYCGAVLNFAQRHKKHKLVGFWTKEKKRLRKNGVVLVVCTQLFWGNAVGSSLKCDTEVTSLPEQVKNLVKDSSGCFVLFLKSLNEM